MLAEALGTFRMKVQGVARSSTKLKKEHISVLYNFCSCRVHKSLVKIILAIPAKVPKSMEAPFMRLVGE